MKFTFPPESRPLAGYQLKRGIARGGFGEVYYAVSDAGKEVAVKLLQHNLDVELRGIQQCLNLRHPNLVAIHDVKTDADGDQWVVMEYIGGQTLEQVLQAQRGPLPLDQIERWLTGLSNGLTYLHEQGIVHRDVKPGNIFWDHGDIKLGDVGLSKFMTPSRRSAHTESVGTVYYMAPEVTYGKYGREVDVYSVGVMLYEMLSGQLPFDGQSTGEILMKHLSEAPDLQRVPAPFRPVLAGALEKDPRRRTGSAAQVLADFRSAQRGLPPAPVVAVPPRNSPLPVVEQAVNGRPKPAAPQDEANQAMTAGEPPQVAATVQPLYGPATALVVVLVAISILGGGLGVLVVALAVCAWKWAPPQYLPYALRAADFRWLGAAGPETVRQPNGGTTRVPEGRARTKASGPQQLAPLRPVNLIAAHQRLAELTSSLSCATVLTLVFAAAMGFLSPLFGTAGSVHPDLGKLGLFTFTTLTASWALLIVTKFSEQPGTLNRFRRLAGLVVGAGVGCLAWWVGELLLVEWSDPSLHQQAIFSTVGRQTLVFYNAPTRVAFIVFFGLLFGLRRWWGQTDPHRPAVFRVMSVIVTGLLGAGLPLVFAFPWAWAVMWATVISCVVQLSAVWVPLEVRVRRRSR